MSETHLPELTPQQAVRFSRQIVLSGFDLDKQERLSHSRVLQIGAGGLGCACAQYLVAAGVGHLTIVDDDNVELSNLQRQVLHFEQDVGQHKSRSAKQHLAKLNGEAKIYSIQQRLDDDQLEEQLAQHDIVLDCSDNLDTRNQLNRIARKLNKPLVSGSAIRMEGQVCCFSGQPGEPCYQCLSQLFQERNLSCVEAGVMSPIVGIIGSMQALEAIKILTQYGEPLFGTLMLFDGMSSQWQRIQIPVNPQCRVCG